MSPIVKTIKSDDAARNAQWSSKLICEDRYTIRALSLNFRQKMFLTNMFVLVRPFDIV